MHLTSGTRSVFVVLAASAILVAACGSAKSSPPPTLGQAPSPAPVVTAEPTASPTPTPTPTPSLGFTPGTVTAPRIVELTGDDMLNFVPGLVQAAPGETITFRIHNVGTAVHEFMVGPIDAAFADTGGTAEVADIGPDQTGEITYTLTGTGPFGFACHAPGHFEHGMAGYIQLVGPDATTVGTKDDPRIVLLHMDDKLTFMPDSIPVAKGETIRFVLTNDGKAVHEFAVGAADKVAADDIDGVTVVEQDKLDEGSTHAVVYTFDGSGPYAFACHEPGHYEAGMKGTITLTD